MRIVSAGSLSAAGREMNLALSVVSKRLASLERRTEARLITRSTRFLAVTDEGRKLHLHAQRILAEIDEAEAALTVGRVVPQGVLRVDAPVSLGRVHLSPVCRNLIRAYPKISIDLVRTDRLAELIDERMDVVIRIGAPKDSDMIMPKLADNHRIIVAAPSYIETRGTARTAADLAGHDCLLYRGAEAHWQLIDPAGNGVEVRVNSRLRCENGDVAHDWALVGCGLIMKSWIDVEPDLRAGRLVRVLPGWHSDPAPICALYPSNRQLPTRVRLLLDALTEKFTSVTPLDA